MPPLGCLNNYASLFGHNMKNTNAGAKQSKAKPPQVNETQSSSWWLIFIFLFAAGNGEQTKMKGNLADIKKNEPWTKNLYKGYQTSNNKRKKMN